MTRESGRVAGLLAGMMLIVVAVALMPLARDAGAAPLRFSESRHALASGGGQVVPTTTPIGVFSSQINVFPNWKPALLALDSTTRLVSRLDRPTFAPTTLGPQTGLDPQQAASGSFDRLNDTYGILAVADSGENRIDVYDSMWNEHNTITLPVLHRPARVAVARNTIFVEQPTVGGGWEVVTLHTIRDDGTLPADPTLWTSQVTALPASYNNDATEPYPMTTQQFGDSDPSFVLAKGRGIQVFTPGSPMVAQPVIDNPAASALDKPVAIAMTDSYSWQSGDVFTITKGPGNPGTFVDWENIAPYQTGYVTAATAHPVSHPVAGATALAVRTRVAGTAIARTSDVIVAASDPDALQADTIRVFTPTIGAFNPRHSLDDFSSPPVVAALKANPYTSVGSPSRPVSVTVDDFDLNGSWEIATANAESGDVSVLHQVGDATQGTLAVSPAAITADGTATSTATATFKDAAGRGAAGDTVTFTAAPDSSTTGPTISATTDNGDGTYTATITSSVHAGPVTITATDTSVTPSIVKTQPLSMSADDAANMTLTLTPSTIRAEQIATSLASVTVTDANHNLVSGEHVTFTTTGNQNIDATFDNGDGTYTATVHGSTQAGTDTITAHDLGLDAAAVLTQTSTAPPPPPHVDPPTAAITAPTGSLVLAPNSAGPATAFSCTEGAGGPGLTSCKDTAGADAPAGVLDTTVSGRRTYRVTATSGSGQTAVARLDYLVAAPPTATVTVPAEGATYTYEQQLAVQKRCVEGDGGTGILSCVETGNMPGAPGRVDTTTAGGHEYTVTATSNDGLTFTRVVHYTVVYPNLTAQIGSLSQTPAAKEAAEYSVTVRGGVPPYSYQWSGTDTNAAGQTPAGTDAKLSFAFAKAGQHSLHVRVTDSAVPAQVVEDTRTFTVEQKCVRSVDLGPGAGTITSGCMKPTDDSTDANPVLRGTDGIKINGQLITGSSVDVRPGTVVRPTVITSSNATVSVRGAAVQTGALNWSIPYTARKVSARGDIVRQETLVAGVTPPPAGAKLLGLKLSAGGQWYVGVEADGSPFMRYQANLVIPDFTTEAIVNGALNKLADVTAVVSVRTDGSGSSIPSAFAQVENAKLGVMTVQKLCFSFVAAGTNDQNGLGGEGARRCGVFNGPDGSPYITCNSRQDVDRWDGTAELKLPLKGLPGIHASGGLSGGRLSYLAAAADFGHSLPIGDGVAWLKQLRAGVCVQPAPLQIKGGASIGAIPDPTGPLTKELIHASGDFLYQDSYTDNQGVAQPWKATLSGAIDAYGEDVGSGWLSFGGNNVAALHLQTDRSYAGGIIKYGGSVDGAMSFSTGSFNVEGDLHACLASVICANAQALVSSDGVSACVTVIPAINLYFFSTPALKTGFGFRWANQHVSIMWAGCSVGDWRATVSRSTMRAARAADAAPSIHAGKNETLRTIRLLGGSEGAPNVVIHGPNGETLKVPAGEKGAGKFGGNMMVRNTRDHETIIQLVKPAPGTWTFTPTENSPPILRVDEAPVVATPKVTGKLTALPGGRHHLAYTYTSQTGLDVAVEEVGADNKSRQVLTAAAQPCGHVTCTATRDFAPALGGHGVRKIVATATRDGHLVNRTVIATYTAPGTHAGPAGKPIVTRTAKGVRVCWAAATGAVSYDVSAHEHIRHSKAVRSGYGIVKTVTGHCADFPAPVAGATLAVRVTSIDAIGGRGKVSSAVLLVPAPRKPAKVQGMSVHRLDSGKLLVTWQPASKITAQFGVVVRHGRSVRQGTVPARCQGMVIRATRGRNVHVTVAALTSADIPGPSITTDIVVNRLGAAAAGKLLPAVNGARCQLRR